MLFWFFIHAFVLYLIFSGGSLLSLSAYSIPLIRWDFCGHSDCCCCCCLFGQIHLLAADRKLHVTHFCRCCSFSFCAMSLFFFFFTLTMFDIVMRGIACAQMRAVNSHFSCVYVHAHSVSNGYTHISAIGTLTLPAVHLMRDMHAN